MNKPIVIAAVVVLGAAGLWWATRPAPTIEGAGGTEQAAGAGGNAETGETVAVTLPELTGSALRGQQYFQAACAACHGPNAGGIDGNGPPLVNRLYVPRHHSDMALKLAPMRGVQAHHWPFGNMPRIEGLTEADLTDIVAFIRAVQQANGIM